MKLGITLIGLAFVGGMAFQEQKQDQQDPATEWGDNPMENPEFLQAWMKSATPGDHHAELAKAAGDWKVDVKMRMDPTAEAVDTPAEANSKMILGGRYLVEEYKSSFMGMPFEGMLIQGYDNLTDEYFSIWLDSMSTWPLVARGKRQEDGKVVQVGQMRDVMTPEGRPYRHVSWEKDGKFHTEMYDTLPDGSEWMVMEMTYHRQ